MGSYARGWLTPIELVYPLGLPYIQSFPHSSALSVPFALDWECCRGSHGMNGYLSVGSVGKIFPNMAAKYMSPDSKELGPGESSLL